MTDSRDYRAAVFQSRVLAPAFSERPNATMVRQGFAQLTGDSLEDLKSRHYELGGTKDGMLRFVESVELVEWGLTGCRAGYFPEQFAEQVKGYAWWEDRPGLGADLAERLGVVALDTWDPAPFDFGEALQESLETVDFRERERLRLVYFAEQYEWDQRATQLGQFAAHLESHPNTFLQSDVVDRVAWGLLPEPYSGIARTPSRWRFEWARAARWRLETPLARDFLESVQARIVGLEGIRWRIEAVARDLDADPVAASATTLQRAIETLRRNAEHTLTPTRSLDRLEEADHAAETPPDSSGRTVREETELKYRRVGEDDYGPPDSV